MKLYRMQTTLATFLLFINISMGIGSINILTEEDPNLPKNKYLIQLNSSAFSNSTCLPSSITNAFVFPRHISEDEIRIPLEKIKSTKNLFGGEFRTAIEFSFFPNENWKSHNKCIGFSYSNQQFLNMVFSRDLYKIIMQGNADFAGKNAVFDDSRGTSLHYETIKFHYQQALNKRQRHFIHFSIGIARGIHYSSFDFSSANLFTQETAEYLDFSLNGKIEESGRNYNKLFSNTLSAGPVADFKYTLYIKKFRLNVSAGDLGMLCWNKNSSGIDRDTTFRFKGIQIENVFNLTEAGLISGDSLLNKFTGKAENKKLFMPLPAFFSGQFSYDVTEKSSLSAMTSYRFFKGYKPQIGIAWSSSILLGKSIKIPYKLQLLYGGWGKFNSALMLTPFQNEKHMLSVGTLFNEGFINPKRWSGNGIRINYALHL